MAKINPIFYDKRINYISFDDGSGFQRNEDGDWMHRAINGTLTRVPHDDEMPDEDPELLEPDDRRVYRSQSGQHISSQDFQDDWDARLNRDQ